MNLFNQKVIVSQIVELARDIAPEYADKILNLLSKESISNQILVFPASIDKHHFFEGGLLQHTYEVVKLSLNVCEYNKDLNNKEIFLGALFHDLGKIYTYFKRNNQYHKVVEYSKTLHISESIKIYKQFCNEALSNNVIHIIKSHHGPIEHGSLEEPATPEAWAVHLADMQSAFCLGGKTV